jgi:chemotaxis protein MotA
MALAGQDGSPGGGGKAEGGGGAAPPVFEGGVSGPEAPPRPFETRVAGRGASRVIFDGTTLLGILGALAMMAIAIALGGAPAAFVDLPAVLIVIGGTLLVTMAGFTWRELRHAVSVTGRTVTYRHRAPRAAAVHVLEVAEFARFNGILKLQGPVHAGTRAEPLLHKGLQLVIDAVPEREVEIALREDIAARRHRHARSVAVLWRAAEVAPAMGLIGTLIGLVQMLGNLTDPDAIGPGMAVALLTTFYGACLANLVFTPLASKLERNSDDETLLDRLYMLGVLSIARKDNPRRLEMQLNSVLPPAAQVHYFD